MRIERQDIPSDVITALAERLEEISIGVLWLTTGLDVSEVFTTEESIREATREVLNNQGAYRWPGPDASAEIDLNRDVWVDRRKLICFSRSASGNPFCFDYSIPGPPGVVWWTNIAWLKVASSPAEFLQQLP